MSSRKLLIAAVLVCAVGGAVYSLPHLHTSSKVKIAPLSDSDLALTKCELHGTPLQMDTVPIFYGSGVLPPGYAKASARQFPHARSRVMGGIMTPNLPQRQEVKFCPQCRTAERLWAKVHLHTVHKD